MLATIYITLLLSIVAITVGAYILIESSGTASPSVETGLFLLAIGFITLALAGYILLQSRKRVATLKIESSPILTTIDCGHCGQKVTREFQRGDYVYKEQEKCPKCEALGKIIAIYREVKEKDKNKQSNF